MGIRMRHPDIEALGEAVDEHQFRTVWAPRGWEVAPAEIVLAADTTGEVVTDLSGLTKAQLHELAAGQGIEVPSRANKDEIIGLIAESPIAKAIAADQTEEA